jgi:hypothetical protein
LESEERAKREGDTMRNSRKSSPRLTKHVAAALLDIWEERGKKEIYFGTGIIEHRLQAEGHVFAEYELLEAVQFLRYLLCVDVMIAEPHGTYIIRKLDPDALRMY